MILWERVRRRAPAAALISALLLPVIVIVAYSFGVTRDPSPVDYSYFGPAGANILTGQWGSVFGDSRIQAGPFELVIFGIPQLLGIQGTFAWTAFYIPYLYALVFAFTLVALGVQSEFSGRRELLLTLAVSAVAILGYFLPSAALSGHPAEVIIPLMWVIAGALAKERQFLACGIVVGLSAGWEAWGVLGAPVVLLAAHPKLVRAALGGLGALVLIYLPYVIAGPFAMFGLRWPVGEHTLVHLLWPTLAEFPWSLRVAQSLIALAAGVAFAVWTRRSNYAVWLVILAIEGARLLVDPLLSGYYWLAPITIVLGLTLALALDRAWLAAATGLGLIVWLWLPIGTSLPGAVVLIAVTIAAGAALPRLSARATTERGTAPG